MTNDALDPDASNQKDPGTPENSQPKPAPRQDEEAKIKVGNTQATNSKQYIADQMEIKTGFGLEEVQQLVQNTIETMIGALGGSGGRFGSHRGAFSNPIDNPDLPFRKYGEDHNSPSFVNTKVNSGEKSDDIKLPENLEEISDWYCNKLSDMEMCFVQAAVVLHGAPVHVVNAEAKKLYTPIQKIKEQRSEFFNEIDGSNMSSRSTFFEQRIWSKELQAHTFTRVDWVGGAKRLLWQDANASGNSLFASRLLGVIAQESASAMTEKSGQDFLKWLTECSESMTGESGWRATRAQGVVWYDLDQTTLRKLANDWAGSEDWWRAANLIDGAYEAEYARFSDEAGLVNRSIVLDIVATWVEKAKSSFQVYQGLAAVRAYERIGKTFLQPALDGLDSLLRFPLQIKSNEVQIPLAVFASTVWSYFTLARYGYVRELLKHLASTLDRISHRRQPHQSQERRQQRLLCLEAMFSAFLLIVTTSLNGTNVGNDNGYSTSQNLEEHPLMPDEHGKDLLLAGILAANEFDWHDHLTTILSAMIVERQAKVAFFLMRVWAEIVLSQHNSQASEVRTEYIRFVVGVGKRVYQWDNDLSAEFSYRGLAGIFRQKLDDWRVDGLRLRHPLGAFAKDVLRQLADV